MSPDLQRKDHPDLYQQRKKGCPGDIVLLILLRIKTLSSSDTHDPIR